jgi:copper transport protein
MTPRRKLGRLAAVSGLALGVLILVATPASAHAVLLQTSPGEGAVLTSPPTSVSLRYDEQVTVTPGGIRVYNAQGSRVDDGTIRNPSPDVVQLGVRPHLANGAYVVTWRVISADTHPVEGAFTFQVGLTSNAVAPNVTGLAQHLLQNQRGDQTVGVVYGALRGLLYAGLALLIGAVAFAAWIWPRARRLRRTARLVWAGWTLTLVATIAEVLIQGIYGAGLVFKDLFHSQLIRQVLGTEFGHMSILRLAILLGALPLLRRLLGSDRGDDALPRWWTPTAVALGLVLALTPALSGHAHTGDLPTFAVPADVIHILAMAVWLGGLAMLVYAVFPGRSVEDLRDAVPRFSRVALACVLALVVTGSFQAWRQVGSIHALRDTSYGHILAVKVVLVLVLVVFGGFSRQVVGFLFPQRVRAATGDPDERVPVVTGGADDDAPTPNGQGVALDDDEEWEIDEVFELRRLKRSVFAEVVIAVAVISVTALLVNAAPAKIAAAQRGGGSSDITLKSSKVWVDLDMIPGVAPGANDVHVTAILPTGAPVNLVNLSLTMDYPSRHIPPLTIPLRHLGPGHYLSPGFTIPFAGNWRVTADVQTDEFTDITLVGTLVVNS